MSQEPSVLDRWRLSTPPPANLKLFPSWIKHPHTGYSAKHFRLDVEAHDHIHEIARTNVELLRELVEFAIPPYESMVISAPLPEEEGVEFTDILLFVRDPAEFYGFLYASESNTWMGVPFAGIGAVPRDDLDTTALHAVAAWTLFVLTFILLLNSKRVVTVSETPNRRTLVKGKPFTYMGYSTIKIDLTAPKITRRDFATGTHATPRRHQVMGHFVHRGGVRGCAHPWQAVTRDPDDGIPRWECPDCGRKRTWRKAFERGDAGKGFVHQKYEVTA